MALSYCTVVFRLIAITRSTEKILSPKPDNLSGTAVPTFKQARQVVKRGSERLQLTLPAPAIFLHSPAEVAYTTVKSLCKSISWSYRKRCD